MEDDDFDEDIETRNLNINTLHMLQCSNCSFGLELRHNEWIKGAGHAIGHSPFVEEIKIDASSEGRGDGWLIELCKGLSHNHTIKSLRLTMTNMSPNLDIFQMLSPFIEQNQNLRFIQIIGYDTFVMVNTLPYVLKKWANNKRKELIFNSAKFRDDHAAGLIDVLHSVPQLEDLRFYDSPLKRQGFDALSRLIRNPESNINALALGSCRVDDGVFTALMWNDKLEYFNLTRNPSLSAAGWRNLSRVLCQSFCPIRKLVLSECNISDNVISCLGIALSSNTALEILHLGENSSVTAAGWQGFSTCLRNPNSALLELHVDECNIDNDGALWIATSLRENTSLRTLSMWGNPMIGTMTSTQWHEYAQFLSYPHSALEELILSSCGVDNEGLTTIARVLTSNFSLQKLHVEKNHQLTSAGVISLIDLLVDSKRALREIWTNDIEPEMITDEELGVIHRALCDKTTIDSTYSSNHTICHCSFFNIDVDEIPKGSVLEEIHSLMVVNECEDKVEVARQKILKYHFSNGNMGGVHALACMHETVLPHSIAWLGRDEDGYSSMFNFVRCFPTLFDNSHTLQAEVGSRKRKISS